MHIVCGLTFLSSPSQVPLHVDEDRKLKSTRRTQFVPPKPTKKRRQWVSERSTAALLSSFQCWDLTLKVYDSRAFALVSAPNLRMELNCSLMGMIALGINVTLWVWKLILQVNTVLNQGDTFKKMWKEYSNVKREETLISPMSEYII